MGGRCESTYLAALHLDSSLAFISSIVVRAASQRSIFMIVFPTPTSPLVSELPIAVRVLIIPSSLGFVLPFVPLIFILLSVSSTLRVPSHPTRIRTLHSRFYSQMHSRPSLTPTLSIPHPPRSDSTLAPVIRSLLPSLHFLSTLLVGSVRSPFCLLCPTYTRSPIVRPLSVPSRSHSQHLCTWLHGPSPFVLPVPGDFSLSRFICSLFPSSYHSVSVVSFRTHSPHSFTLFLTAMIQQFTNSVLPTHNISMHLPSSTRTYYTLLSFVTRPTLPLNCSISLPFPIIFLSSSLSPQNQVSRTCSYPSHSIEVMSRCRAASSGELGLDYHSENSPRVASAG
jgi:hypothetical protein